MDNVPKEEGAMRSHVCNDLEKQSPKGQCLSHWRGELLVFKFPKYIVREIGLLGLGLG